MKKSLNKNWTVRCIDGTTEYKSDLPCSVYSVLLENKVIENPYVLENEKYMKALCEKDYVFKTTFSVSEEDMQSDKAELVFNGVDTIADITINNVYLGSTLNFHRTYVFDIKKHLKPQDNELCVTIKSPLKYIEKLHNTRPLHGMATTVNGYPYIRKPHYMFGWDFCPVMPDMGIWRDVELKFVNDIEITDVRFAQKHENGSVDLSVFVEADILTSGCDIVCELTDKGGNTIVKQATAKDKNEFVFKIDNPDLWWPNGFGEHPLYKVTVTAKNSTKTADCIDYKIGLRDFKVCTDNGEFAFKVNGIKIFAMGADYVPEDNILPFRTKEKTEKLLRSCVKSNYNSLRVWGGGLYPENHFYDLCDELGIIVWQDFMFACAVYKFDKDFEENVVAEMTDNIKRLRHHASLGLWCGNNENETMWADWGIPQDEDLKADYLRQFEEVMPSICGKLDPDRFYMPSSPTSRNGFDRPNDFDYGDTHEWGVWHNYAPAADFRKHKFRFCSEYGFEALPDKRTVEWFAQTDKCDLSSSVIKTHHKCEKGEDKLNFYLDNLMPKPKDLKTLVYSSQLMQSDAVRLNVENMRRFRGVCMGSTYWQVNDTNPTISWSSMDYFNRPKALHYCAKRFYAPIAVSINEGDIENVVICVANETIKNHTLDLIITLAENNGQALNEYKKTICIDALSSVDAVTLDLSEFLQGDNINKRFIQAEILENGKRISSSTALFCAVKDFEFVKPDISMNVNGKTLTIDCKGFAKAVCISADTELEDNWFDMLNETVEIKLSDSDMTVDDFSIITCADL